MKQFKKAYLLIGVAAALFTSCIKETTVTSKYHYSSLSIAQVAFPDAVTLDFYINGKFADSIPATGGYKSAKVTTDEKLDVVLYKTQTKERVLDTVVTVPKQGLALRLMYSPAFAINRFIQVEKKHEDSVYVQLIGNWNTTFYPYSKLDVYVYSYVSNKIGDLLTIADGLEAGKMDARQIPLYHLNEAKTSGIQIVFKLWDPISQQFVKQKSNGSDFFLLIGATIAYNGYLSIIQITDSGAETVNRISAKLNTIN